MGLDHVGLVLAEIMRETLCPIIRRIGHNNEPLLQRLSALNVLRIDSQMLWLILDVQFAYGQVNLDLFALLSFQLQIDNAAVSCRLVLGLVEGDS